MAVPRVGVPFRDAVTPLGAGIAIEKDEAARRQPLLILVSGRVATEVHVDRRAQAHGRDNWAEAVPVDVGGDPLSRQVLVDDRLFERLVGVEQLLRFLRRSFTHRARQLCQPLGQRPDAGRFVKSAAGVAVLVPEVHHAPREVREPLRVVDMREQPVLLGGIQEIGMVLEPHGRSSWFCGYQR